MLSNIMTRAELIRHLDEEYQKDMNAVHWGEVREADDQYQKAVAAGCLERQWYWGDVLDRVRRGERLEEVRRVEAEKRNGPLKVETVYGVPTPVRDLDVWLIG